MVLIDALYINNSGGFRLLDYLVRELIRRNVDFFLLADIRCYGKFDHCRHLWYMKASLAQRKRFYMKKRNCFSCVLCFGNIPAPIKLTCPVYTYFHNINLLTLSGTNSLKERCLSWMKRQVFRHYKKNTDCWLVQTSNTSNELVKHLGECKDRIKLMPFFELELGLKSLKMAEHGGDYVFVSNYTGAKGHEELLEAWLLLHKKGVDITLHLTIPYDIHPFVEKITNAREQGVHVINHGIIPFDQVLELYRKSKVIIYPSHNESLGLGIIEAITAGCDVLGADLPYIHSICKPSEVFDPYIPESIVNAVISYEKGVSRKSELLISNSIDELIGLLNNN